MRSFKKSISIFFLCISLVMPQLSVFASEIGDNYAPAPEAPEDVIIEVEEEPLDAVVEEEEPLDVVAEVEEEPLEKNGEGASLEANDTSLEESNIEDEEYEGYDEEITAVEVDAENVESISSFLALNLALRVLKVVPMVLVATSLMKYQMIIVSILSILLKQKAKKVLAQQV